MPEFKMNRNTQSNIAENARILQAVYLAYIEAIYFTDTGEGDQPESNAEMDRATQFDAMSTCADFLSYCEKEGLLQAYSESGRTWDAFGHDFWLTRNGHGVGFWDRGMGELGDTLSKAAKTFGECTAYAGDNGLIYTS